MLLLFSHSVLDTKPDINKCKLYIICYYNEDINDKQINECCSQKIFRISQCIRKFDIPWCWEKLRARGERGDRGWDNHLRLDGITNSMDISSSKFRETVKDSEDWHAAVHGVAELDTIYWLNNKNPKAHIPKNLIEVFPYLTIILKICMNFITNHKFLEAESNFPKLSMITKNVFINHPRGYFYTLFIETL